MGGLYLEGLIHEGAYFQNFTVVCYVYFECNSCLSSGALSGPFVVIQYLAVIFTLQPFFRQWSFKRFIVFVCMKWRSFYNRFLIQTVTIIVYIFLKFQLQVKMTVQKILNLTDCLIWSLQKYNTAIISASSSRDHNINIVSVISMVGVTIHVTGCWRWWTKHDADQSYGYTSSSGWTRCKILGKPDKKWYKASSYWHCFFIIVQIN